MIFDIKKKEYAKEHIFVVEIDLDYCNLTYGIAPCVAGLWSMAVINVTGSNSIGDEIQGDSSGAIAILSKLGFFWEYRITNGIQFTLSEDITNNTQTGSATRDGTPLLISPPDEKCFNTFESTQDVVNYDPGTKTYRFCEDRSPHPIGINAIPSIISIDIAPAIIDLKGGLGVRSNVSITFRDHPHSDIDVDKYVNERTWIASDRATFWTKLRSRNPNYQFKNLRVISAYLESDGSYAVDNTTTRHFIINRMDVGGGQATITAMDPLKLASNKKALAPAQSTGQAVEFLLVGDTSVTLKPSGVGNSEYPASGKVLIGKEVISFTRAGDILTLTRAQNNTIAATHNINDIIQLCLEYNDQVNIIVKDLLVTYAKMDASFIPDISWQSEVDTHLSGLLAGIIVKPHDVWKLLKELSEAMPHYLWWDERSQSIQLTVLKAPPPRASVLNMNENLIKGSVSIKDQPKLRISTVLINFGQFDPTKKLDELDNYEQSYAREDPKSIVKYGSNEIMEINSRWISNSNRAAALQLAALIGRRFSNIPRSIDFSLDAKDSDIWIGQSRSINHRDIVDFTGVQLDTVFQLTSVKEDVNYEYSGLEFVYGDELPEDEGGGDPDVDLLLIPTSQNVNLRDFYDTLFTAPDASTKAKFIIESGVVLGGAVNGSYSIDTGSWPAGAIVTLQLNPGGFGVGKGGEGGVALNDGEDGSHVIILNFDLELINNGVIGAGGGGGGGGGFADFLAVIGGGGAGDDIGGGDPSGTKEFGGVTTNDGGHGGNLGEPGKTGNTTNGGLPGNAINKNGFVLTETVLGDIRGAII